MVKREKEQKKQIKAKHWQGGLGGLAGYLTFTYGLFILNSLKKESARDSRLFKWK